MDKQDALTPEEEVNRRKYSGEFYHADTITVGEDAPAADFFTELDRRKLHLLRDRVRGARVLDLGCATGVHLHRFASEISFGCGLDFSLPFLGQAVEKTRSRPGSRVYFLCGNLRRMPFRSETFDVVCALAVIYHVPEAGDVFSEIGRVLRTGGVAILDLGNKLSLNTLVARAHTEAATPFHLLPWEMRRALRSAGLRVEERHCFQLLPHWGNRPRWLRPLLHPWWTRILERRFAGRMLDERLSSLPVVRCFAFRHLLVCRRV